MFKNKLTTLLLSLLLTLTLTNTAVAKAKFVKAKHNKKTIKTSNTPTHYETETDIKNDVLGTAGTEDVTTEDAVLDEAEEKDANIVKLRNGATEEKSVIITTMALLNLLIKSNDIQDQLALYELVEKCRNNNHEFFTDALKNRLVELSLINANGDVHNSVKNIVLSLAEGSDLNMYFHKSPVAPETFLENEEL